VSIQRRLGFDSSSFNVVKDVSVKVKELYRAVVKMKHEVDQ